MTVITFVVDFHSTFRVGAAYPNDGVDLTYDEVEPLPPDHLKGIMKAEAEVLVRALGLNPTLIRDVFGTAAKPTEWSWFAAEADWSRPILRHRVAIDPDTHAAKQDHLVASTSTMAERATFRVERHTKAGEDASAVAREAALLRLAGRSVHHLGGWRRRGYGCVGVSLEEDVDVAADIALLQGAPAAEGQEALA